MLFRADNRDCELIFDEEGVLIDGYYIDTNEPLSDEELDSIHHYLTSGDIFDEGIWEDV